jgi:HSP90 family molecular chaperone
MSEYLEEKCVKDLVKTYSEFIGFPIKSYTEKTTENEVTNDNDKDDEDDDASTMIQYLQNFISIIGTLYTPLCCFTVYRHG